MKRILILLCVAGLLIPTLVVAAGSGVNTKCKPQTFLVSWHYARTTAIADSATICLETGTAGFGMVGSTTPDTSKVYDARDWVVPMGGSVFMGFCANMATATAVGDSAGVIVQWSYDGTSWFGLDVTLNTLGALPTVGLSPTLSARGIAYNGLVEAATMVTIPPNAQYCRFIAAHWDGNSVATAITSFKLWVTVWVRTLT
jgi:hypothetical protein